MGNKMFRWTLTMVLLAFVAGMTGCQNTAGGEGIHVLFKGVPKIQHTDVFYQGRVVGAILEQSTADGGASMVTIRISPEYMQHAGRHWAFYVDMGRLTAGRLSGSGNPVQNGDRMSGFQSKGAFNWFKVKTLLRDRIAESGRRAEKLHRQFVQSG